MTHQSMAEVPSTGCQATRPQLRLLPGGCPTGTERSLEGRLLVVTDHWTVFPWTAARPPFPGEVVNFGFGPERIVGRAVGPQAEEAAALCERFLKPAAPVPQHDRPHLRAVTGGRCTA